MPQNDDKTVPGDNKSSSRKPRSKYKFIKDNWGSRAIFQFSYGLKMEPEDIEEGNEILRVLMEGEREDIEAEAAENQVVENGGK